MEFRQVVYFVEVAKREHVSEAAEELHVAQSAISRQIANLELELGVALFEREGRNVKLTPIGRLFLPHAEAVLKTVNHAKQQIEEFLDPERGTVKIGFPSSLASHTMATVISSFKEEHPNVKFHLRQGSYAFLIEAVKKREIDIAFIGPVPTEERELNGDILFMESFSVLLPFQHPLANRDQLVLNELKNDLFVTFPKGYILHNIVMNACKQAGFHPIISSEGEDLDAIKGLVSAGMGVTLLPENTLHDSTPRYTVKVPISMPEVKRNVGVIYSNRHEMAPSVRSFYEFVKQFFAVLQSYQ